MSATDADGSNKASLMRTAARLNAPLEQQAAAAASAAGEHDRTMNTATETASSGRSDEMSDGDEMAEVPAIHDVNQSVSSGTDDLPPQQQQPSYDSWETRQLLNR